MLTYPYSGGFFSKINEKDLSFRGRAVTLHPIHDDTLRVLWKVEIQPWGQKTSKKISNEHACSCRWWCWGLLPRQSFQRRPWTLGREQNSPAAAPGSSDRSSPSLPPSSSSDHACWNAFWQAEQQLSAHLPLLFIDFAFVETFAKSKMPFVVLTSKTEVL